MKIRKLISSLGILLGFSLVGCEANLNTSTPKSTVTLTNTIIQSKNTGGEKKTEEKAYETVNIKEIQNATWTWEIGRDNEKLDFKNNVDDHTLDVSFDREVVGEWAVIQVFFEGAAFAENKSFFMDVEVEKGGIEYLIFDLYNGSDEIADKKYARKLEEGINHLSVDLSTGKTNNPPYLMIFVNEPNIGKLSETRPINYPAGLEAGRRKGNAKLKISSMRLTADEIPYNPDDEDNSLNLDGVVGDLELSEGHSRDLKETWLDIEKLSDGTFDIKWDSSIMTSGWSEINALYDFTKKGEKDNVLLIDLELVKGEQSEFFFKYYSGCPNNTSIHYQKGRNIYKVALPEDTSKYKGTLGFAFNSPYNYDELTSYGPCEVKVYGFDTAYDPSYERLEYADPILGAGIKSLKTGKWAGSYFIVEGKETYTSIRWDTSSEGSANNSWAECLVEYDITNIKDAEYIVFDYELVKGDQKNIQVRFKTGKGDLYYTGKYDKGPGQLKIPVSEIEPYGDFKLLLNSHSYFNDLQKGECEVKISNFHTTTKLPDPVLGDGITSMFGEQWDGSSFDVYGEDEKTIIQWNSATSCSSEWAAVRVYYDFFDYPEYNSILIDYELIEGDQTYIQAKWEVDGADIYSSKYDVTNGRKQAIVNLGDDHDEENFIKLYLNSKSDMNNLERGNCTLIIYEIKLVKGESQAVADISRDCISSFYTDESIFDISKDENGYTIVNWDNQNEKATNKSSIYVDYDLSCFEEVDGLFISYEFNGYPTYMYIKEITGESDPIMYKDKKMTLDASSLPVAGTLTFEVNGRWDFGRKDDFVYGPCTLTIKDIYFFGTFKEVVDTVEYDIVDIYPTSGSWNDIFTVVEKDGVYTITWDNNVEKAQGWNEFKIEYDLTGKSNITQFYMEYEFEGGPTYFYIDELNGKNALMYNAGKVLLDVPDGFNLKGTLRVLPNAPYDFTKETFVKGQCKLVIKKVCFIGEKEEEQEVTKYGISSIYQTEGDWNDIFAVSEKEGVYTITWDNTAEKAQGWNELKIAYDFSEATTDVTRLYVEYEFEGEGPTYFYLKEITGSDHDIRYSAGSVTLTLPDGFKTSGVLTMLPNSPWDFTKEGFVKGECTLVIKSIYFY